MTPDKTPQQAYCGGVTQQQGQEELWRTLDGLMWTVRKSVWGNIWKSGETFDATPKICGRYFPPKVQKN